MRKKILVAAVAGALAAPIAAFAQYQDPATTHKTERVAIADAGGGSSVTISGALLVSIDNHQVGNAAATRTKTSETHVQDESSSLVFGIRENLGNGLAAVGRVDFKVGIPAGTLGAFGDTWVGLDSKDWGSLTMGRHSFHYFKTPEDAYFLGASYRAHPSSLIDFAGGGRVAIANATRTPNAVKWISPNWSGFQAIVGWSASPTGASALSADMTPGNTARSGRAWNVNPTYTAANWAAGYSFWDSKSDAPSAVYNAALQGLGNTGGNVGAFAAGAGASLVGQLVSADQRSDSLYGHYMWGGWKLGAIWNKTKLTAAATAAGLAPTGTELSNRSAWSIPLRYATGPHTFMATYTKAQDDSATAVQDGAKMVALTYAYAFSKRTFLALSLAKLTNDGSGAYTPYVSSAIVTGGLAPGESARTITLGMRHNF